MGLWLKGLGLTIWGLVGLGLTVVFIFVGYQAALKYRSPDVPIKTASDPKESTSPSLVRDEPATTTAVPRGGASSAGPGRASVDITRPMFQSAAALHQHYLVIEYGEQLIESGAATADDMASVAQSYSSIGDCANARASMDKAVSAFHAAGREAGETQRQVVLNCRESPRVRIDPAHQDRVNRLLRALRARAEADRESLPKLEAEADAAQSGNPSVILGELLYGFGEFGKAVQMIKRGLEKGDVKHLDDAYVYLGLAEQAQGDIAEARTAFAHLKDVPGISARVLKLWTLYAEVELKQGAP